MILRGPNTRGAGALRGAASLLRARGAACSRAEAVGARARFIGAWWRMSVVVVTHAVESRADCSLAAPCPRSRRGAPPRGPCGAR
eukprot:7381486-Prymnesium_polylepis.1